VLLSIFDIMIQLKIVFLLVAVEMAQGAPSNPQGQVTINAAYCQRAFANINGNKQKLSQVCYRGAISRCKEWKANCANVPKPVQKAPAPVRQVSVDPKKNQMMQSCCTKANVPQACMQYCQYEVSNPKQMACNPQCLAAMRVINACAANGKNNRKCCGNTPGFPSQCLNYCAGNAPTASVVFARDSIGNYMPCFDAGMTIMQCHKQNATNTPQPISAPYNGDTTDKFPSQATNMVQGYCAINTGNVLQAVGGASSLGSLVNGFGG